MPGRRLPLSTIGFLQYPRRHQCQGRVPNQALLEDLTPVLTGRGLVVDSRGAVVLDGQIGQAQGQLVGPDEKQFSIYRSHSHRHARRAALKYRVPVLALGAKPETRSSKFRVAVLPLPHRRRKPLAEGQPHRIESRLETLLQLSILVLPLVLVVVGTAYFIYHFDSSTETRQESAPFIHNPKLLHTNGIADDLSGFGWRRR